MKMIKTIMLATLLSVSVTAAAQSMPPTKTYEAMLMTVRLPNVPFGTLAVRGCSDCDFERYRVTPNTTYKINNKSMRLGEFRAAIRKLGLGAEHNVNVRRDIQTNTITSVFLFTE